MAPPPVGKADRVVALQRGKLGEGRGREGACPGARWLSVEMWKWWWSQPVSLFLFVFLCTRNSEQCWWWNTLPWNWTKQKQTFFWFDSKQLPRLLTRLKCTNPHTCFRRAHFYEFCFDRHNTVYGDPFLELPARVGSSQTGTLHPMTNGELALWRLSSVWEHLLRG